MEEGKELEEGEEEEGDDGSAYRLYRLFKVVFTWTPVIVMGAIHSSFNERYASLWTFVACSSSVLVMGLMFKLGLLRVFPKRLDLAILFVTFATFVLIWAGWKDFNQYVYTVTDLFLGLFCLATVLTGKPFALDSGAESVPPAIQQRPLFKHVCERISVVWAGYFLLTGGLQLMVLKDDSLSDGVKEAMTDYLPLILLVLAIVFTVKYPPYAREKYIHSVKKYIQQSKQQKPYSPLPSKSSPDSNDLEKPLLA